MKLSEIVAELKNLKATVAKWGTDAATATADAIKDFSAKLANFETATVAELTQALADLGIANGKVTDLTKSVGELTTANGNFKTAADASLAALDKALGEFKIEFKAETTPLEKISLLQNGVSSTLAKMNIKQSDIPAPKAASSAAPETKTVASGVLAIVQAKAAAQKSK